MIPTGLIAQSSDDTATETPVEDTSDLLSSEELQELVGPIALYPDTLLIQLLVAATYPLDVIKADRILKDNADASADELKALIDAEGFDESVAVLATAFPEVLTKMAVHIDWTEAMGNAMLAQSDDVMDAVQVMRETATENGALASGDEQIVEVTQTDTGDETIIIQPADPQVVYVPQYDPEVVYVESNDNDAGDAIMTGLIAFGTFALIDEIFDNDDPWNNYWGCHNCGGWGGGPIVRNPDIDIDIDGDVNIGNRGDNDIGWKPDDNRKKEARDDIARRKSPDGKTKLPTQRPDRGDEMRASLSKKSGAADISRDKAPRAAVEKSRPQAKAPKKPSAQNRAAVDRTGSPSKAKAKATAHRPQTAKAPSRKPSGGHGGGAINKRASAPKASAGGARGHAAAGGRRR